MSPSGYRQANGKPEITPSQRKKAKLIAPSTSELADLERDMEITIEQAPLAGLQDATFAIGSADELRLFPLGGGGLRFAIGLAITGRREDACHYSLH